VYNYAHIGNLRTYVSEDILEKSLKFLGYNVIRAMNITDVGHLVGDGDTGEDKLSKAAKKEKKSVLEIAEFYTNQFFEDFKKLNIDKPKIISKATDNIDEYIKIISKLLEKDYAYISNGNVYFDTSKYDKYYELSGRNKEDMKIASREEIEEDKNKRNPFDFGLWFTNSKFNDQELKWDSPWGVGYPGWHIECSGIAIKYLGEHLDIHCGAEDAIFPHHTNEIAQSECYLDHKWCNYWVHLGFLIDTNGKMSKSSGEFLTLSLLESKGYNPLSYRYFCLNSHYHKQLEFNYNSLDIAQNAYFKLKNRVQSLKNEGELDQKVYDEYILKFKNAIENDLNTSLMITNTYDILKENTSDITKIKVIKEYEKVLSLDLFKEEKVDVDQKILDKIEERTKAKQEKNYALADEIRKELEEKGIRLIDTKEGTKFERI
jgi:cysteinyl-tRNA synthetase